MDTNEYEREAKERWGQTEAYRQSKERTKDWTRKDYARLKEKNEIWIKHFVTQMPYGPESKEIQTLIDEHYNSLRTFYEPNLELYRGLAEMDIADPRFTAYYEAYATGLAQFMHDAMIYYVDTHK